MEVLDAVVLDAVVLHATKASLWPVSGQGLHLRWRSSRLTVESFGLQEWFIFSSQADQLDRKVEFIARSHKSAGTLKVDALFKSIMLRL